MQKMLDNLLSHPTIIKSSTHKDLQYLSSKLSYIQSKVAIITNGKTSTTSPPGLISQRNSHYEPNIPNNVQFSSLPPSAHNHNDHMRSPHANDTDSNNDHTPYAIHGPPKHSHNHKHNNNHNHRIKQPNLNNLSSQSSPYKSPRKS